MIVVSTAFDPPPEARERCLASVAEQRGVAVEHVYIDAGAGREFRNFGNEVETVGHLSHFENLLVATATAPDDEVIVSLDGDDWLAGPGALARVQEEHDAGALVTYGSFRYADGRPGFAAPPSGPLRSSPWTTTHLKTFRAGLLRRIKPEHLQDPSGRWLEHARDLALMFPLIEMAGPRAHYIADVLMIYNYANSTEFRGGADMLAAERAAVAYVRSLPPYEALS